MSGSTSNSDAESYARMLELMRQMRTCEEEGNLLRALKRRFKAAGENIPEMVAMIREARRGRDEVSGARCDEPLGAQLGGKSVANPLQCGRVAARGHEHGDPGLAKDVERRSRLSR